MLTFFSTAKPFEGHSGVIQRNALQSWKLLHPEVEIILFGDEAGVAEICAEMKLRHEPHVERHESGMKYLNYMFARARELARHEYLCYSNCDIIQLPRFGLAFGKILARRERFLMVGRRWDADVAHPLDFQKPDWSHRLYEEVTSTGFHQTPDFIDFFVFPRKLYGQVPPLIVGRSYWDHWLVWKALSLGVPVIDCSRFVAAVHQNHGYSYHPQGKLGTNEDELAQRNFALSGNGRDLRSLHDATYAMTGAGMILRTPFRREFSALLVLNNKQEFLNRTLRLRRSLGLRKETIRKFRGYFKAWFS